MTNLVGPYDHVRTAQKTRVQACIPLNVHEKLFLDRFPRRGAQDKIICKFLDYVFHRTSHLEAGNSVANEDALNEILSILDL
tara:strand:+ start:1967 stop:2212 length:246 start_codon:yes stop_codon:yes gene_type:complete